MPEEDFNRNIDNLFIETVFTSLIDGVEYEIYSQAVPQSATVKSQVKFYFIFMIEKEQSYAAEMMADVSKNFNVMLFLIVVTVLSGFLVVIALIMTVGMRTSSNITNAIDIITEYTERLKKATNVEGKQAIIGEISQNKLFIEIGKKWGRMQLAKQSLIKRHRETSEQSEHLGLSRSRTLFLLQKDRDVDQQRD